MRVLASISPLLVAAAVIGATTLLAQDTNDDACPDCRDVGWVTCPDHPEAADYVRPISLYCEECARSFSCCGGTGLRPCQSPSCIHRSSFVADLKKRHERWRKRAHLGSVKNSQSMPTIDKMIASLPGNIVAASSNTFFVFTNRPPDELRPKQLADLKSELKELNEHLPSVVNRDLTIDSHEWLHLFMHRCETERKRFLAFIGLTDGSEEAKVLENRGLDVAVLCGHGSQDVWRALHGSRRTAAVSGVRFLVDADSQTFMHSFTRRGFKKDWVVRAQISHYAGAHLTNRFMMEHGSARRVPYFLATGMAHHFELANGSKRTIWRVGSHEFPASDRPQQTRRWSQQILKAVRGRNPPTVARLTRLIANGAASQEDDRVASWSFLLYLRSLGAETLGEFMVQLTETPPSRAMWECYGLTEQRLTADWHKWVTDTGGNPSRASSRKIVAKEPPPGFLTEDFAEFWKIRDKMTESDRVAAIDSLEYGEAQLLAEPLITALREGDDIDASRAILVLRRRAEANTAAALIAALQGAASGDLEPEITARLLRAGGGYGEWADEIVPHVLGILDTPGVSTELRARAVLCLGELGTRRGADRLLAAITDPEPLVRAEAARALASIEPRTAREHARRLINDDSWHVRLASIGILKKLERWQAIPLLIDRLSQENGRLREDIVDALQSLSGHDKGDDPLDWETWWENHGKKGPENKGTGSDRYERPTRRFPKIYSKKAIFLLDISSSMNLLLAVDTGYDGKEDRIRKLEFVRDEMIDVIEKRLEDDVELNIYTFARKTLGWKDQLVLATPGNRKTASRFLKDIKLMDNRVTDIVTALRQILEDADQAGRRGRKDSKVDTIYLVSDGYTTWGQIDSEVILSWFREANRLHHIRVNTITIGAMESDQQLMLDLAHQNYGQRTVVVK